MAMNDILRQLKSKTSETAGQYRKVSVDHTKGFECLMGEKNGQMGLLCPLNVLSEMSATIFERQIKSFSVCTILFIKSVNN